MGLRQTSGGVLTRSAAAALALLLASAGAAAQVDKPQDPPGGPVVWPPRLLVVEDEGRAAAAAMSLPPGFSVALFAAEPQLAHPVALWVAHDGAVYVAETFRHHGGVTDIREHWDWLDDDLAARTVADRVASMERHLGAEFAGASVAHERITVLRDQDGDGRADRATVFADGFSSPETGIGAGVLLHDGALYFTCIPDLWRLADTNGDDQADQRNPLHTGYGVHTGLLGHDLHGLRVGPDRRLYFSMGDRGLHVQADGRTLEHAHTGAVLRCNLDGSDLRVVHTGLRNPQELAFDDRGRLFTVDNNSDAGDQARLVEILPEGDSGWRFAFQWIEGDHARGPWREDRLWEPSHPGQAAWHLPPLANLSNGPSGLTFDPGTGLSPEWRGHFLLCDFGGGPTWSGVHGFALEPRGASFSLTGLRRFVWDVLATDAEVGPDGALYLSDWVEGWNRTGRGRIWRISADEAESDPVRAQTEQLLATSFARRTPSELALLLAHPDQRVRQGAQFALVDHGPPGLDLLERAARRADDERARLHGLWGLWIAAQADPAWREPVAEATADRSAAVREQAWRVLADLGAEQALSRLTRGLSDPEPRVRLFAALAAASLGERATDRALPGLLALLTDAEAEDDATLRYGAVTALAACRDDPELLALLEHEACAVRQGAVLALRRRASPLLAAALTRLGASERPGDGALTVDVVRAIYDLPVPSANHTLALALERSAPLYERTVGANELPQRPVLRRMLAANRARGDRLSALRVAAVALDSRVEDALRVEALELLATWEQPSSRDPVTGEWRPLPPREGTFLPELARRLMADRIERAPLAVREALLDLLQVVGVAEHAPRLEAWMTDETEPGSLRARCLQLLATLDAGPESGSPDRRAALERRLARALASSDSALRAAALPLLARLEPGSVAPYLPKLLTEGEPGEQRAALELLSLPGLDVSVVAELLDEQLERLAAGLISPELRLDVVLAAEAGGRHEPVEEIGAPARSLDPVLAPWLDGLYGGDALRGQALFDQQTLACTRCHTVRPPAPDDGPRVGPSLAGLGQRRTRLAILTALADPHRTLTTGWESTTVVLRDGTVLNGRVLSADHSSLTLLDADGTVHELPASQVLERRAGLSAMPEGLLAGLDRRDVRDLLEYLAGL